MKLGTNEVFFAATDIGLLKSTDAAEHWGLVDIPGSMAVTALYFPPNSSKFLVARAANGIYVSEDSGDHWSKLNFPLPPADVNGIAVPADSAMPLLAATRAGLYMSSDAGSKWSFISRGLPASTVNSVIYVGSGSTAYAVGYGRLYQTNDGGSSWSEISTSLPSLRIRQLWQPDATSNRLYAVTNDIGIIYRD